MRGTNGRETWDIIRLFATKFFHEPDTIGAICPSSRYLASRMVEPLGRAPGLRIVEFGPGTGPFTEEIRRRLPAQGRYLAIELDPVFVGLLRERFPDLDIANDSATNLIDLAARRELLPVDHIVSGIPFAGLAVALIRGILDAAEAALRPGGTFTTFQYVHAYGFGPARFLRDEMRKRFGPLARRHVVFRNIPPAFVFTWQKPTNGRRTGP